MPPWGWGWGWAGGSCHNSSLPRCAGSHAWAPVPVVRSQKKRANWGPDSEAGAGSEIPFVQKRVNKILGAVFAEWRLPGSLLQALSLVLRGRLRLWGEGGPLGAARLRSRPGGSPLSWVGSSHLLPEPLTPALSRGAIVKLTPGGRWLGMRRREQTHASF